MKRIPQISLICACALLAGCGGGSGGDNATSTATGYTLTDLGVKYGSSRALGLNNLGQVVGEAMPRSDPQSGGLTGGGIEGQSFSFLYANGSVTDLKPPELSAINDSGQIVGGSGLYQNNKLTQIPAVYSEAALGGPDSTNATAINNQGQIVGSCLVGPASLTTVNAHAVLYANGQLTDLGTLNGVYSNATAINNQGQIVGYATIGSGISGPVQGLTYLSLQAFLWQNGVLSALATPDGGNSEAYGINDGGQIVGAVTGADGSSRVALWQNGNLQDVGIPGQALGINNAGQIVGSMTVAGNTALSPHFHAFLYQNGHNLDLNTLLRANSGWELTEARAINNRGQICGTALYKNAGHAYLLTPLK